LVGKKVGIPFKDIADDEAWEYGHDTETKQHLSCLKAYHLHEPDNFDKI